MPPKVVKKKAKVAKDDQKKQTQEKEPQPKVQKPVEKPKQKTVESVNSTPAVKIQHQQQQEKSKTGSNVVSTERPPMSEQQLFKLRQQKFKRANIASNSLNDDEKTIQQRLAKFGGQPIETKEQLQLRRKKFSNPIVAEDDQEVLRMRREKFANKDAAISQDDPAVLEQRKRKFARNEEATISLDDEIAKTKNKFKKISKDRLKNPSSKFGKGLKHRKPEGSRRQNKNFRQKIFGKKNFIRRERISAPSKISQHHKQKMYRPKS